MPRRLICLTLLLSLCSCMQSLEDQTKKSPKSIIGKTTTDVGQFDPSANNKVSDSKVRITDPILGGAQAYGPMLEQISKSTIEHAVRLFEAENGRYPQNHEEFMEKIIKANNIALPVLPGGKKYQYDVAEHKLVVIDSPEENK
jgi:hypothetical protein